MKKIFHGRTVLLSLFHFFILSLLCSCDPVAEDERYEELPAVEAQRCVLLEEFTGQTCPNCPTAHRTIEALKQQYGESLIPVSIHAGGFGLEEGIYEPYFQTLMTPEGDTYASSLGIKAYPSGVVNRGGSPSLHTEWASLIRKELERPSTLSIELHATIEDSLLTVNYTLQPQAALEGRLQLWVLESGIVSLQTDGKQQLTDYVHDNVYRASVNGVGGEYLPLKANVFHSGTSTLKLQPRWDAQHLSVVAFYYTPQSGVEQAAVSTIVQN